MTLLLPSSWLYILVQHLFWSLLSSYQRGDLNALLLLLLLLLCQKR